MQTPIYFIDTIDCLKVSHILSWEFLTTL